MMSVGMILFLALGVFSSVMLVFVSELFWLWVMIDLSTIFLIPFLSAELEVKKSWYTGVATYFVVQFFGSASILYGILISWVYLIQDFHSWLIVWGFILKLGLVPFHLWVPRCFVNFHYGGIFIVGAAQKAFLVLAMPMFYSSTVCNFMVYSTAVASMLYGPVAMFNSSEVKPFLGYSSVTNTGFMVLCLFISIHVTSIYAFVYTTSMFFLSLILATGECEKLKSLGSDIPLFYKPGAASLAISFAGFPPFVDFFMKFLVLQSCMDSKMWISILVVLTSSFINLLVWIWMLSFASTGSSFEFYVEPSMWQKTVNLACVMWNSLGGLFLALIY
uniref:NADH-ubiquinone oxidoreductase chain 2 n=1 Tax=Crassostrea tulipa TaxID=2912563 RepID=A0A0K0PWG1_9BIVA|nr:NADH dehydrogenase subunit 2 [Crassostrea gasar]AKQ78434.1 NADH dehydrogenase subunit 2 [Crassostrea gasar]